MDQADRDKIRETARKFREEEETAQIARALRIYRKVRNGLLPSDYNHRDSEDRSRVAVGLTQAIMNSTK